MRAAAKFNSAIDKIAKLACVRHPPHLLVHARTISA
jgi:hypothetical protein